MSAPGDRSRGGGRRLLVIGALVVAAVVAAGLYFFFSGDTAPEADLQATASALSSTTTTTTTEAADAEPGTAAPTTTDGAVTETPAAGIAGSWTVDSSIGEFSVTEQATATFAGFRVDEVLSGIGDTTAIGRTPRVSGTVAIEGTTVTAVDITVDLTAMISDRSRREGPIQRALNTGTHPNATFVLAESIELGATAAAGEVVNVTATGDLTVNGVTNRVEIPLEAQLIDGNILAVGSTSIIFSDYEVTVPSAPVVVSVEDEGTLELQLWLSR